MIVRSAWIPTHGTYSVQTTNDVYNPHAGTVSFDAADPKDLADSEKHDPAVVSPIDEAAAHEKLQRYLNIAALANLATLEQNAEDDTNPGEWTARGAPTEIAVEVFAARFGWGRSALTQDSKPRWTHVNEFPFDSDVKKMSVLFNDSDGQTHVFTKASYSPTSSLLLLSLLTEAGCC